MELNRRRGQLQAYLAGIIDGEGSFGIYAANGTWQGRLTLNMQDPEAVLLFKLNYPDGYVSVCPKNGKETYTIVYSHFRALEITQELIPYLIIKHEQAKVLVSFLVHRRRQKAMEAVCGPGCLRCVELASAIDDIRARSKGVNSVNALLAHGLRKYRANREEVAQDVAAMRTLLDRVETRDRCANAIEPISAPEQEIVQAAA